MSSPEADVDRIVAIRLTRAARRTEQLLRRVDALERRVKDLEAELGRVEPRFERLRLAAEPAAPGSEKPARQPSGTRFGRSEDGPARRGRDREGARIVASQLLDSGLPAASVAAHLQDLFDLPDASGVVAEVAAERS